MTSTVDGFLRCGHRELPRGTLMERAARAATGLEQTGVQVGGAVAILMRNDVAFVEAVFAAGFVGAHAVPLNWHFTAQEIDYILADAGATHVIAHADLLHRLQDTLESDATVLAVRTPPEVLEAYGIAPQLAEPPATALEWDAWVASHEPRARDAHGGGTMMYTSGTTGRPKGVRRHPVSAERRDADAQLRQRWFGNRPGLRTAIVGPMYHSVQLSYTLAAVSAPGAVLLEPRFDAEHLLALIESERLTHLHLVPIMMSRLAKLPAEVRARYDVSSLELVIHGSAPCPAEVKRALIAWLGPIVHEYYGATETGMVTRASSEEWLQRPGTVGRAWPGREVRIYDEAGALLPAGREGEVYVSLGPMSDFTYQNAPADRVRIDRAGCVTNGDVGYLDDDGYLFLCDRLHDMVISGGVNIYPPEIEAVLVSHPAVLDAAVFGVPDEEYGESLMGVVQLCEGGTTSAEELRGYVRARLAAFKAPRVIELRHELPRDASGKLAKHRLREPYWRAAGRRI